MRARFLLLVLAPLTGLGAQAVKSTTRPSAPRPPAGGACASMTSMPSDLVRTPEGMALLRFKRELEGVATVVGRDSAMKWTEARRMFEVQRGIDSLVQVFVRARTADDGQGATFTVRRGDSTVVFNGRTVEGRAITEVLEGAVKAMRPNVEVTLRSLEPQLQAWSSGGARAISRASSTGYLGINLSGSQIRMVTDSGSFTAHCDYPMIEAVDVGSPARQADLRAGDTITAYNGRDVVAQTVNYPQLLVPGKVVRVRVRRDGKAREVPVTVAERPQELVETAFRFVPAPGGMVTSGPARPGSGGVIVRTLPAPTPPTARVVAGNASMMSLLGAQLNAVDDEFAQTLGLEPGILVMRVQAGTPAAEAGLRAGELILAVNGTPARELSLLQRAVSAPGAHDVKLTVTARETPARIVTIRF